MLEQVARTCSPELFLLTVIAICFGTAYLTNLAGVSLSLGAFLAGLVVSESRFSQHALGEILPLADPLQRHVLRLGRHAARPAASWSRHLPLVARSAIAAVLLVKVLTTGGQRAARSATRCRSPPPPALMLAQVGEFSFVLERAGREVGLSPAGLGDAGSQAFIATTVRADGR